MVLKEIEVHEIPTCAIPGCDKKAPYDVKTVRGPWGDLCEEHFKQLGTDIGSKRVMIKATVATKTFAKTPTVTFKLTRAIVFDEEYPSVKCPWCGKPRDCEMDANYTVTCEGCKNEYNIRSPL